MKKIVIFVLFTASFNLFALDQFAGTWRSVDLKAGSQSFRLSYKEASVAPTYGLSRPGRIAYNIHLDFWGLHEKDQVEYILRAESKEFAGVLIKDSRDHQYAKITEGSTYIWLEGNVDCKHTLEIIINGEELGLNLDL